MLLRGETQTQPFEHHVRTRLVRNHVTALCAQRVRRICLSPENHDNYKALFDLGYQSSDDLKSSYAAAFGDSYEYMVPELGALLAAVSKDTRDYSYERDICDDVTLFHGMTLDMARSPPRRRAALPRPPHRTLRTPLSCRSSRAACLPSCATSARTRTPRTPRPSSGASRLAARLRRDGAAPPLLHPSVPGAQVHPMEVARRPV